MAAQCGMTLVKRFTYRGDTHEEFSNTYHFTGTVPADTTAWNALRDALVAQEKTVYTNNVTIVRVYGYATDAPDSPAVYVYDYLAGGGSGIAGTLTGTGRVATPGDTAFWVRWKTSRNNSNGKAIYLRKYFHDAWSDTTGGPDVLYAGQKTAAQALGVKLRDGSFLDARTLTARGHSDTLVGSAASTYLTTRTLKRRGKRPGS